MEIISIPLSGDLKHQDNMGNTTVIRHGDIQVMSAGSGIRHSEWNEEAVDTRLYQIWIEPRTKNATPRWEARQFPKAHGALHLLASGRAEAARSGALWIDQDAAIWGGTLAAGQGWQQALSGAAYLFIARGEVALAGETLQAGDGVAITELPQLALTARTDAELELIDLA